MSEGEQQQPSSLLDEIARLKQQILALEEEEDEFENDYEELLATNPELIHKTLSDMLNTKQLDIRATPSKQIEDLLKYFKGCTLSAKKAALIRFLQTFPCFKTTDIKLLKRRLKRLKRIAKAHAEANTLNTPFWQEIEASGFLID